MHMRAYLPVFSKEIIGLDSELSRAVNASPFARANFHCVFPKELQSFRRNIRFADCAAGFGHYLDVLGELVLAEQQLV